MPLPVLAVPAFGTVLAVAGIGATAIDVGMEGARAAQGKESVFDFVTGGPAGRDHEEKFMDKCRKTAGAFSDECPDINYATTESQDAVLQQNVDQTQPAQEALETAKGVNFIEKHFNSLALGLVFVLLLLIKKL